MQMKGNFMFYVSALIAIVGATGYQYFVKRISLTLDPIISVISVYVVVLVLSTILLFIFPAKGGISPHIKQLGWVQVAVAITVFMIELGFLLMYRFGWNLSTGNLITGVIINVVLLGLGVTVLGEKLNTTDFVGIALCILGVALVGYRG